MTVVRASVQSARVSRSNGCASASGASAPRYYKMQAPLCAAVLAAGFSARLGRDKATVRIAGRTLLERTVTALLRASVTSRVPIRVIIIRGLGQRRHTPRGTECRINLHRSHGISASIRCAIRAAPPARAVLLLAVDLPQLDPLDLARMLRRWRRAPNDIVARAADARPVMPLILPRRYFDLGLEVCGDRGLSTRLEPVDRARFHLLAMRSAARDADTSDEIHAARHALLLKRR